MASVKHAKRKPTPAKKPAAPGGLPDGTKPGVLRWAVKTLQDPAANKVDFANVVAVTPTEIANWPPMHVPPGKSPPRGAGPQEFKVYQVTGKALKMKLEADGDYHFQVEDQNGNVINVEIVQPKYAPNSLKLPEIEATRTAFEAMFGASHHVDSAYRPLDGRTITARGVGFWDELHGQGGNANGFELHPTLSIKLADDAKH